MSKREKVIDFIREHSVVRPKDLPVPVKVFCPAKTIADCFKYRNKISLDVALEALREGWSARKFTLDELLHYAGICRFPADSAGDSSAIPERQKLVVPRPR